MGGGYIVKCRRRLITDENGCKFTEVRLHRRPFGTGKRLMPADGRKVRGSHPIGFSATNRRIDADTFTFNSDLFTLENTETCPPSHRVFLPHYSPEIPHSLKKPDRAVAGTSIADRIRRDAGCSLSAWGYISSKMRNRAVQYELYQ